MNKDRTLIDLVKVYKKSVPEKLCKNIITRAANLTWKNHVWASYHDNQIQGDDTEFLRAEIDQFSRLELSPLINSFFESYIKEISGPYQFNIQGFSVPKLNRYDAGTKMSQHNDHIYSLFNGTIKGIPILSIVGLLNDEFEGGEFVFWDSEVIKLEVGDILIFPSLFAYPHRVNTITNGLRYSFVSWAY